MKTFEILRLFREKGHSEYGGEAVTQIEHALQTAYLAELDHAEPSLIAAALLHDIGHLLHALPDDAPDRGLDDHHEASGFQFVNDVYGPDVAQPVRLHVDAKRYLCAVDASYFAELSEPSVVSLRLQGGPMSDEEITEFRSSRYHESAVRLRRWDDEAKVVGRQTPELQHYEAILLPLEKRRVAE